MDKPLLEPLSEDEFEQVSRSDADVDLSVLSLTDDEDDVAWSHVDDDVLSFCSDDTTTPAQYGLHLKPESLPISIRSCIEKLERSVQHLSERQPQLPATDGDLLNQVCHSLFKQACEIEKIAASFERSNEASQSNSGEFQAPPYPLDPSLIQWSKELDTALTDFGMASRSISGADSVPPDMVEVHTPGVNRDGKQASSPTWQKHLSTLQDMEARMAEFLPILRADMNAYHFPLIPLVSGSKVKALPEVNTRPLRQQLYTLKDTLANLNRTLHPFIAHIPADSRAVVEAICFEIQDLVGALTTYLTNHGSDWLDSLIGGGLSFSEFRDLDRSYLMGMQTTMSEWEKSISFELELVRLRTEYPSWQSTEARRAEKLREMIADCGWQLDALKELKRILKV